MSETPITVDTNDIKPKLLKWQVFLAGSGAGLIVDTSLYPIDTIKSRLQSEAGFLKSGGFKSLYRGLQPVLAGSIPSSSVFFITYETLKEQFATINLFEDDAKLKNDRNQVGIRTHSHISHVVAASMGEVAACLARVPTEVVKVRSQTSSSRTNINIVRDIIREEGPWGLYRGFISTIIRDAPFSAIQFPIWELLKSRHQEKYSTPAGVYWSALYGSISGGTAAFLTTPLDVAKTRIMLSNEGDKLASGRIRDALKVVWSESGFTGLFAGVLPRMIWISIGGAIWLGSYEKILEILANKNITIE